MGRSDAKVKAQSLVTDRLYDITLNDSANASKKFNRARKVDISDTKRIASKIMTSNSEEANEESDEENGHKPTGTEVRTSKETNKKPKGECVTYPADIWHLIARYIPPDQLGTFALICRDSNRVLQSVHFWRQQFNRYYKSDLNLPRDLRAPSLALQKQGLRCRTIRLFFLACPALSSRLLPPLSPKYEPYALLGMQLQLMWYENERNYWNYYFQFKDNCSDTKSNSSGLFYNPEAGCRILKVSCPEFVHRKYVDERYLCSVYLGLTSDMVHQRLTLGFSDYVSTRTGSKAKLQSSKSAQIHNVIILERITKCVVLDWWHPDNPLTQEPQHFDPVLCSSQFENEEW